jgi:hypothetical protein
MLDSGRIVAVRSLKLRASELSRRHGNVIRKAKLL